MIFTGINNFRDMGGVQTKDGHTVKKGLLFRSGHLADATEQDLEQLKALNVQLIFDYRDEEEANNYPSPVIDGIEMVRIPAITEKSAIKVGAVKDFTDPRALETIVENFAQFYATLPLDNPSYKALLNEFVACKGPILQYCTAGKDRTGVGAALMYLLLGVPEETIFEEYLLTNDAVANNVPKWYTDLTQVIGELPQLKMLVGVSKELLQASLNAILEQYGSYEQYFEKEYGITQADIEKVRAYYVEA